MFTTPAFAGVFELFVTWDTLGAGSDRKQPTGRDLWTGAPLWTIAEHLYESERDTPHQDKYHSA
ncbi:hypothetical protein GCM10027605_20250 [Micromonospora zhanjiangensis]